MFEAVGRFLGKCPLLPDAGEIMAGSAAAEPGSCALAREGELPVERYFDGGGLYRTQYALYLRARMLEDADRRAAEALLEGISDWLREENAAGRLPEPGNGRWAARIAPVREEGLASLDANGAEGLLRLRISLDWREKGAGR